MLQGLERPLGRLGVIVVHAGVESPFAQELLVRTLLLYSPFLQNHYLVCLAN